MPIGPILSAALPPLIAGAGSSILQNVLNRASTREQNEYNSPASQMERFRDAGLNPHLIYSQGSAGNQPSATQYESPDINPYMGAAKFLAIEGARKRNAMMDQQGHVLDAQEDYLRTKTQTESFQSLIKQLMWQREQFSSRFYDENTRHQSEALNQQVLKLISEINFKNAAKLNLDADRTLKEDVHTEKDYFNTLRRDTGLDRGNTLINPVRKFFQYVPEWIQGLRGERERFQGLQKEVERARQQRSGEYYRKQMRP